MISYIIISKFGGRKRLKWWGVELLHCRCSNNVAAQYLAIFTKAVRTLYGSQFLLTLAWRYT